MATRKKAKPKRKKTPLTGGRKPRKTIGKTSAIRKKAAKKTPLRRASAKKTTKAPRGTAKLAPVRPQAEAVRPTPPRPQRVPAEQRVGVVTHYYSHLSVATLRLEPGTALRVGDVIHILGQTTDFTQRVESLEVDHKPVLEVGPNDDFGLKVSEHAREHDVVFKVRL
jgi:translation elongation factor EF-Tu-like GTPase